MKSFFKVVTFFALASCSASAQATSTSAIDNSSSTVVIQTTKTTPTYISEANVTLAVTSYEAFHGDTVTLSWLSEGLRKTGHACKLYKNSAPLGIMAAGGHIDFRITETTTFLMDCITSKGKSVSDQLVVNLKLPPANGNLLNEQSDIASVRLFLSDATVTEKMWLGLSWHARNVRTDKYACQLYSDDVPFANVDGKGNWAVFPEKNTTYRIRCYDIYGKYVEDKKNAKVEYVWEGTRKSATGTVELILSKNNTKPYEQIELSWKANGARERHPACQLIKRKGLIIGIPPEGKIVLTPTQTFEYKIRCVDREDGVMHTSTKHTVVMDPKNDIYNPTSKLAFVKFTDTYSTVYAKRMSFLYWETNGVRQDGQTCQLFQTNRQGQDVHLTDIVSRGRWPVFPEYATTYTIKCFDQTGAYTTFSKTFFVKPDRK